MGRTSSYTDQQKYVIYVLWLAGYRLSSIAKVLTLTPGKISGIVTRSAFANRTDMTMEERQAFLDDLKSERLDGGSLQDIHFRAMTLDGSQKRDNSR